VIRRANSSTPILVAATVLLAATLVPGSLAARQATAAPPCPVPATEYVRVAGQDEAVASALTALSSQYEGAERDGTEYANAQYEAVVAAGYTFNCKKSVFVKRDARAAEATGDPSTPTSSTTTTTTTTLPVKEYRTPKQVTTGSGLDLGAAEIAVVAILGLVALGAALTISRS
jgi:hypothetical protein